MTTTSSVTLIILNYNGEKSLEATLSSVLNLKYPSKLLNVIIADNHSHDSSPKIITKYQQKLTNQNINTKIINFPSNYGFAKANNLAIKQSTSKYVALLNNDCIVDPLWLINLVKTADSHLAFSVGSKIKLYPRVTNKIQNIGSVIFYDGYTKDIGAIVDNKHHQDYEIDVGQYDNHRLVYSTCGAAVLYNRQILLKLGLYNELFFMYYEDLEISERALLSGYTNLVDPRAIVYHHHSLSSQEWSRFFVFHTEIGRLFHIFLHFPFKVCLSELLKFIIRSIGRTLLRITNYSQLLKSLVYHQVIIKFMICIPRVIYHRYQLSNTYNPIVRQSNYQSILSGYWYDQHK